MREGDRREAELEGIGADVRPASGHSGGAGARAKAHDPSGAALRVDAGEGIEQVLILPFTTDVACLTAEDFVEQVLVRKLGARAIVVGENFRFGHKQAGDTRLLLALGDRLGFVTEVVTAVSCRGMRVSSSGLRQLLEAGDVVRAERLLGRPYALEGTVISGRGVGAKKTVPTLNLATRSEVLPKRGVYVTRTSDLEDGRSWESVTNIGYRPTFGDDDRLTIETFLLEPLVGETPGSIRVEFLWRLRDERKFESPEALKTQILKDCRARPGLFSPGSQVGATTSSGIRKRRHT